MADLRKLNQKIDQYFILSLVIDNLMRGNTHMSSLIPVWFYTCMNFNRAQKTCEMEKEN